MASTMRLAKHLSRHLRRPYKTQPSLQCICSSTFPIFQQKRYANGYGGGPQLPGQLAPQPGGEPEESDSKTTGKAESHGESTWRPTLLKMFESAATTMVSLIVLG